MQFQVGTPINDYQTNKMSGDRSEEIKLEQLKETTKQMEIKTDAKLKFIEILRVRGASIDEMKQVFFGMIK